MAGLALNKGNRHDAMMKTKFILLALALSLVTTGATRDAIAAVQEKPKITVKKKYVWKGYGFLPGYPRTERERQRDKVLTERRYFDRWGRVSYGFGGPGFYRGQYNGGSFGPCWTSTPIGMMRNGGC
jgi:hypothetical protein